MQDGLFGDSAPKAFGSEGRLLVQGALQALHEIALEPELQSLNQNCKRLQLRQQSIHEKADEV